ncbi:hypothetical protein [Cellulophaga sp. Hel_I_12]|uniref:hypothetical protein n=1 Tax=Cellulophaga sp. Hel_I_12 TaxID=1249972 RepID=UPI0006469702|nr:hypothetical protein [Cellulophaga sp. Hel_I_12]
MTTPHLKNCPKIKSKLFSLVAFLVSFTNFSQETKQLVSNQYADTWSATDDLNRLLALNEETGDLKENKFVGIFYFIWLGAHGYDQHSSTMPDEGIYPKKVSDTESPYDINKILKENPKNPGYGPDLAFHHWAEPYFGYYLSNDEWVIAKHSQLLSDAGIDVIVFDVTNGLAYIPQVTTICKVFSKLQEYGWEVPQIAFLTNTKHVTTTEKIYNDFYKKNSYKNLWFYWKGKPLMMGNQEGLSPEITEFFNFRRSWAWTEGQEWFGDGKDKWPWIDHYPQNYGWHESKDIPEQITVASAQHPVSNIGRSFHDGHQPSTDSIQPDKGLFFSEQWKRALDVDPEFVFITGWNEWVAMRFSDGRAKKMMGKTIEKGDVFFVDQYNEEFSRDIEPMKDGFKDNYYYQMVDNIRKFKGTRALDVETTYRNIIIDGEFDDWNAINNSYFDHKGDIESRSHPGWGRIEAYTDTSGRHDFVQSKIAETQEHLFFYTELANNFTNSQWPENLSLLINSNAKTNWKGYTYRITLNKNEVTLEKNDGGWKWTIVDKLKWKIKANKLEVSIPKKLMELTSTKELKFKWLDNVPADGDIMKFYDQGDVAPNARFTYRYQLIQSKE